jgi:hypothetical protein
VLVQPELADYFTEELKTLPPVLANTPLIEKIRGALEKIRLVSDKAKQHELTQSDARAIHEQAREINAAISRND